MNSRLSTEDVAVHFAGLKALDGVDLWLGEHEILGLIGPNGAGKTTLLNVLNGYQRVTRGTVRIGGRSTTTWPPHRVARAGVARVFQDVRAFSGLTVLENVEIGALADGVSRRAARGRAWEVLDWLDVAGDAFTLADDLSYGAQRKVGIARALAMRPDVLFLDEPASGLAEHESDELSELIRRVRNESGASVLVVEHDMRLILGLCDRVHVLDHGQTLSIGTPDDIRRDPEVARVYLGTEAA